MVDRSQIHSGMEVIASDGAPVGTVDQLEGEAIRLTRAQAADGKHHLVPLIWVDRVDAHVHLNVGRDRLPGLTGEPAPAGSGLGTAAAAGAIGGIGASAAVGATASAKSGDGLPGPLPPVANPTVDGAKPRGNYYLPWIVGGLFLILLLFLLLNALGDGVEDGRENGDDDDRASISDTRGGEIAYAPGAIAGDIDRFLRSNEPTPRTFTIGRLNFDPGSAAIRQSEVADMDQLAQVLTAHPGIRVAIIGYADAEGGRRSNARLGAERAESVVAALNDRGIDRSRLEARSGGEQAPLADNDREAGRAENRRTELIVLSR